MIVYPAEHTMALHTAFQHKKYIFSPEAQLKTEKPIPLKKKRSTQLGWMMWHQIPLLLHPSNHQYVCALVACKVKGGGVMGRRTAVQWFTCIVEYKNN